MILTPDRKAKLISEAVDFSKAIFTEYYRGPQEISGEECAAFIETIYKKLVELEMSK